MRAGRSGDQDNPHGPEHCRMRAFDRDLIRGGHYGQRSPEPQQKAEHMAAPTTAARVKKTLANPEPSTHGPSQRATLSRPTVAFGALRTWTDFHRATICSE